MKKYIIILISFFLLLTGCSNNNLPQIEKENKITDGITFKTEYEKENSISLYDLSIDKENPFKYINKNNIDSVFSNDSIIYIGSYNDLCSRLLVDQLIVFSKENNIKDIYYFNINLISHRCGMPRIWKTRLPCARKAAPPPQHAWARTRHT